VIMEIILQVTQAIITMILRGGITVTGRMTGVMGTDPALVTRAGEAMPIPTGQTHTLQ
jgi:hypothetical protein